MCLMSKRDVDEIRAQLQQAEENERRRLEELRMVRLQHPDPTEIRVALESHKEAKGAVRYLNSVLAEVEVATVSPSPTTAEFGSVVNLIGENSQHLSIGLGSRPLLGEEVSWVSLSSEMGKALLGQGPGARIQVSGRRYKVKGIGIPAKK